MPYPDYSGLANRKPEQQDKNHSNEKHSVLRLLRRKTDHGVDWFAELSGSNSLFALLFVALLIAFLIWRLFS